MFRMFCSAKPIRCPLGGISFKKRLLYFLHPLPDGLQLLKSYKAAAVEEKIRQLGIFIVMDLLLLVLAAFGLFVYGENRWPAQYRPVEIPEKSTVTA